MSDTIKVANKVTNPDTSVHCWQFRYEIDLSNGKKLHFGTEILASVMTDSTDGAEAKTKANVKATEAKTAGESAITNAKTVTVDATLEGAVTL